MTSEKFPLHSTQIQGKYMFQVLQEACVHSKLLISGVVYTEGGPSHQKIFHCTISLSLLLKGAAKTISVAGQHANSKITAKHYAAAALLNRLGVGLSWYEVCSRKGKYDIPPELLANVDSEELKEQAPIPSTSSFQSLPSLSGIEQAGNPAAASSSSIRPAEELEIYCYSNRDKYTPPTYTEPNGSGPSHKPTFHIECQICVLRTSKIIVETVKEASSKKQVKQTVANKMLKTLRSLENGAGGSGAGGSGAGGSGAGGSGAGGSGCEGNFNGASEGASGIEANRILNQEILVNLDKLMAEEKLKRESENSIRHSMSAAMDSITRQANSFAQKLKGNIYFQRAQRKFLLERENAKELLENVVREERRLGEKVVLNYRILPSQIGTSVVCLTLQHPIIDDFAIPGVGKSRQEAEKDAAYKMMYFISYLYISRTVPKVTMV